MLKRPIPILITILAALAVYGCSPSEGAVSETEPSPVPSMLPSTAQPDTSPTATYIPTATSTPTETPVPSPTPLPDRLFDSSGVEMVLIPAGEFTMGSDTGFVDERPVHLVYLDVYYIDLLETTNHEYRVCVEEGICEPPRQVDCCAPQGMGLIPDYFSNPAYDDYPVTWLNWYDAVIYCAWRGARLPTEAEWEKAARGTDARTYPWGDEPPTPVRLNFYWPPGTFPETPLDYPAPVGSYPLGASPYGVLDMAGNVYEWVQDVYAADYYERSPYENPSGPEEDEGQWRIARGGSFWNQAFRNRSANRNNAFLPADLAHFDAGIRCAMDVPGG